VADVGCRGGRRQRIQSQIPHDSTCRVIEVGRSCKLYDLHRREYLDMAAGIVVTSLEHGDPDVTATIGQQSATLIHTSNVYYPRCFSPHPSPPPPPARV
jgi:acetylornithine/succinyldiaminopimelate/putrescine aminotransferase